MTEQYYTDYPKAPIGGRNPYYLCAYCGISEPQINGKIENHADWCEYRKQKEAAMRRHPLTDKMCEMVATFTPLTSVEKQNMRDSADWQLERDAEYFADYLVNIFGLHPEIAQVRATHFKQAMRTQQQEEL